MRKKIEFPLKIPSKYFYGSFDSSETGGYNNANSFNDDCSCCIGVSIYSSINTGMFSKNVYTCI